MKTSAHKPRTKRGSEPKAKSDSPIRVHAELQAKLGVVAGRPHQVEAANASSNTAPTRSRRRRNNPFLKFLTYLWGPIPWMIEAAVVLSALASIGRTWHHPRPGFWLMPWSGFGRTPGRQRHAALKAKLRSRPGCGRDGKWVTPPARELVPGDVIRVRLGDIVPADARLLDATRSRWISPR